MVNKGFSRRGPPQEANEEVILSVAKVLEVFSCSHTFGKSVNHTRDRTTDTRYEPEADS